MALLNLHEMKRLVALLALLIPLAGTAACIVSGQAAKPIKPSIEENVAERDPDSLAIDVIDFDWVYFNGGSHLRVTGTARNNTGAPIQAVTLSAILFDEGGRPVGYGSSYIAPTYLPDGAEGSFEMVAMPARTQGIKHIRLVTHAKVMR